MDNIDLSSCSGLVRIGGWAFAANYLSDIDLSSCTALGYIDRGVFLNNLLSNFSLPVNTEYEIYGWKDTYGDKYNSGDIVTDLESYYYIPVPYILTDSDVEVVDGLIQSCSYNFELTDIIIPEILDAQIVRGIADGGYISPGVFQDKDIKSIVLPSSLVTIGKYAFAHNSLTQLDLSANNELTKIGIRAFEYNSLKNLDLTGCTSLDTIGNDAFYYNHALSDINFSACSSLTYIGDEAFKYTDLTSLDLSGCSGLKTIGSGAFLYGDIENIILSGCSSLTTIGIQAFAHNEISDLDMDACYSLTYIGESAFGIYPYANLESFVLPVNTEYEAYGWKDTEGNVFMGADVVSNLETFYYVPVPYTLSDDDVVVTDGIIQSCSYDFELKDIIIPEILDGQTVVGIANKEEFEGVFYNKGIRGIDLPQTIETIGDYAFHENELTHLNLNAYLSLTIIGNYSFAENEFRIISLKDCHALDSISDHAFEKYRFEKSILDNLDLSSCTNLSYIGAWAFATNNMTNLNLSSCISLTTIGRAAYIGNDLTNIDFSDCIALEIIHDNAFYANNLLSLDLSYCKDLREIEGAAFAQNSIASLNLNSCSSLISIGASAFGYNQMIDLDLTGCTSLISLGSTSFWENKLTNLDLSSCKVLQTIGAEAFDRNQLERVNLDSCEALHTIEYGAFWNNNLSNIDLSSCQALQTIGSRAFMSNNLENIDLHACTALTSIESLAFNDNPMISFNLPIPDLAGYILNHWIDGSSNTYEGGETVNDLTTSYSAILTSAFNVSFNVNNGTIPIHGASVYLAGYNSKMTNGAGVALIDKVVPENNIPFTISAPGYDNASGTVTVVDDDITVFVTLLAKPTYNVDLIVIDGTNPIEGAIVNLSEYGSAITDVVGKATFRDVLSEENISYTVSASGFNTASGTLTVVDSDISQTVILDLTAYSVIFTITDGTNPVEGAEVSLSGYGSAIADANGQATFRDVLPEENIPYSVAASGFITESGKITVVDSDINQTVILDLTVYSVIFTITDGTNPVEGAEVSLTGYGSAITDAVGQATFSDVLLEENIPYSVAASGFNTKSGTLTVVDSDKSQTVILDLTAYSVIFTITDGTNPVEGAEVSLSGYGSDITDAEGQATFSDVLPEENIPYSVAASGFNTKSGTLTVVDSDISQTVILDVSGYLVIFTITDGTSPIEGAEVSLSGYGSDITDAEGQATFSDVLPEENIPYSVAASGFITESGTLTVVDSDKSQTVIIGVSGYAVIFTITDGTNPVKEQS